MISVGIGAFYGILLTPDRASPAVSILIGIANGLVISGVIAGQRNLPAARRLLDDAADPPCPSSPCCC